VSDIITNTQGDKKIEGMNREQYKEVGQRTNAFVPSNSLEAERILYTIPEENPTMGLEKIDVNRVVEAAHAVYSRDPEVPITANKVAEKLGMNCSSRSELGYLGHIIRKSGEFVKRPNQYGQTGWFPRLTPEPVGITPIY